MNEFFFPKNVAIYGVSSAPGNIGVGILDNLERFSFKGNVFLIGEKGGSVRGKNIAKSIEEIELITRCRRFYHTSQGHPQ